VHLRAPSISKGVQSFLWSLVFFLVMWLGMAAVGVSAATSFIVALVAAFLIFLFVRTHGEDAPLQ
jgi:Flp pilus assembly protein TadB